MHCSLQSACTFIISSELRECHPREALIHSFIHSSNICSARPHSIRYKVSPHATGRVGRSLARAGARIGLQDNFSTSSVFPGTVWKCLTFGCCAPESGRAAWASSLLPKEHSPPALEETATEHALPAALGSGVRSSSSLGSTGLLPFLSSVLTRS